MRLADDERARVPFALVGALLLVSSVAVATVQLDGGTVETDAREVGDRAAAVAEASLRDAVRDAGATAAASPVVEPADESFGQLLDAERPYRSYLELLVALRLRERAAGLEQRVGDARARLELAPIDDRASARDALNRTHVEAAGTGLVAATVEDVRVVVERDGRVVDERTRNLSVTVATPAITLHDRTAAFERRLDAGLRTEGSLARGLTGGLYGLAWTRGWGQYLGLPIDDPLANRHVELVANLAAIDAQRATFGSAAPGATTGLARAAREVAAGEAVGFAESGLADAGLPLQGRAHLDAMRNVTERARSTTTVGVNRTADRALADLLASDGAASAGSSADGDSTLDAIVREAATVEVRLATATEERSRELVERSGPENRSGWRVERSEPSSSVERVIDAAGPTPRAPAGWSLGDVTTRRVAVETVVPVTYEHAETGRRVPGSERYRRTVDVGVATLHRPKPFDPAAIEAFAGTPDRPLAGRSGPLYDRLVERATARLVAGDADAIAGAAATDQFDPRRIEVAPDDASPLRDAAYDDLAGLREELRDVQTETTLAAIATDADPAGDLRDRVAANRARYVGAPARYDDLRERAVVAARGAYVERVLARLDERSEAHRATQDALGESVADLAGGVDAGLSELLSIGLDHARPAPATPNATPPAPALDLQVRGAPAYLDRDAVSVDRGAAEQRVHPLAVKTSTVPALPTDEIAAGVGDLVGGAVFDAEERVPLSVAAQSLRGANAVTDAVATERGLGDDRAALRAEVADAAAELEDRSAAVVAAETALSERRAEKVVERGLARWPDPAERALAFDDGEATDAIASAAAERDAVSDRAADRARTALRDETARALASEDTHVSHPAVEHVATETRNYAESVATETADDALAPVEDALSERFERMPVVGLRGAPVAPVPGYWLATANVWHVEVKGTYPRLVVSTNQASPTGGAPVRYVRDGSAVRIDVTGDGTPERLGTASRVSFEASTTVLVAVPPSSPGVGNDDADATYVSPGWERWAERAERVDGEPTYAGGRETPGRDEPAD